MSHKGRWFWFLWRKGFSVADYFGSLCLLVAENTGAFFFPLPVSPIVILLSSTRGTVPFSLVIYFPPFHLQLLFIFLLILGCCGTEYAVRGQPTLWNKWVGKSPKQNLFPTLLHCSFPCTVLFHKSKWKNTAVQQGNFSSF